MKNLIFTGLIAIIAVGGAFARSYYSAGSNTRDIICDGLEVNCFYRYNIYAAYTVPFSSGLQGIPGTIIDIELLQYDL